MKTGLVLEGGGMRCLYTSAILDCFLDQHIRFDGIVGVSAGATFGCNFKSGQRGRALRYNKRFAHHPMYCGLRSLLTTGDLVNRQVAYHDVPVLYDKFDMDTFRKDPAEFHCVCTDVATGKPVYRIIRNQDSLDDFLTWVRASASMPLVSNAVEMAGYKLLDGGISDSIPLAYFQQQGYGKNVVILTQPAGFYKKQTALMPIFRLFCKYPKIVEGMKHRHEMYNAELEYIQAEEKKGNTLLIYPDEKLRIGRADMHPDRMDTIYALGLEKGRKVCAQVKDFLAH